jgi:hypothetical protein
MKRVSLCLSLPLPLPFSLWLMSIGRGGDSKMEEWLHLKVLIGGDTHGTTISLLSTAQPNCPGSAAVILPCGKSVLETILDFKTWYGQDPT